MSLFKLGRCVVMVAVDLEKDRVGGAGGTFGLKVGSRMAQCHAAVFFRFCTGPISRHRGLSGPSQLPAP